MNRPKPATLAVVPLDARPCTRSFPVAIGEMAGANVLVPPPDLLGDLIRPGSCDDLMSWLEDTAGQVDAAVVALDTLLFGGLIPARRSRLDLETLVGRLDRIARLPVRLYAFAVTMRISDSDVAEEEMPYWAEFGKAIYRWSFHADRHAQLGDPADAEMARQARATLPGSVVDDFLSRRRRHLAVHEHELALARRGAFEVLCLTQDDTSPFGFNQAEKRQLVASAPANALIYPGADEVATCLVGRWINDREGRSPAFRLQAFPPTGAKIVAMYEDRPLSATVAGQVRAVGGRLVEGGADLDLLLNAPATGQGDLALQVGLERVDSPERDLAPLIERLRRGPPAALADVAFANGADVRLWELLGPLDLSRLAAYAAWNTAGNTLGTVVAMASAYLSGSFDPARHRAFMLDRLADDYLYQGILRRTIRQEDRTLNAGELGDRLAALWRERLAHVPIAGIRASFPWNRTFEAAVEVDQGFS